MGEICNFNQSKDSNSGVFRGIRIKPACAPSHSDNALAQTNPEPHSDTAQRLATHARDRNRTYHPHPQIKDISKD